ncbi:MAG: hypothetical protein P8I93_03210 [Crocinitomicaceae bacterium]|nr:hypothetical protein [Crocinitomicaceae bacterium]
MKIFVFLLIFCFAIVSCKKRGCTDPNAINFNTDATKDDGSCEYGSNCLYTTINNSFSELDLSQTNNDNLFIRNLNEDYNSSGLTIDLNCDGINDLRIDGEADQDWIGSSTTKSSELRISTLHSNVFILLDSIADSTFNISTNDTTNFNINSYNLTSSYPANGSVFSSSTINSYVTPMDSNSTLMANDPRWKFTHPFSSQSSQIVRSHYEYTYTYSGAAGNGYYVDATNTNNYYRGIVPNYSISWIPIKFITNENLVKLGYLKIIPKIATGYITFEVDSWAIQR